MNSLQHKTVLITGGTDGIGRSLVLKYLSHGANVVTCGRTQHKIHALEAEAPIGKLCVLNLDIAIERDCERLVNHTIQQFGSIDVLINNAAGNFVSRAEDISPNGWNAVINIVLNGTAYCTMAAGRHMLRQGSGKVLSISAAYAWYGGPGTVHSAAAKAGVIAMSQTLAVEWGPRNVQINCLCPGFVGTEQSRTALWPTSEGQQKIISSIPAGRFETVEETVEIGLFLCTPMANYINGEVLVADGAQWLNKGVFVPPPPEQRYQKV